MNYKEFNELYNKFWIFFKKDILKHEGGYVNNPNDKGSETKFGISKKVWGAKIQNIKDITEYQAFLIYFVEYFLNTFILDVWDKTKNFQVVSKLVDMAINIGVSNTKNIYDKTVSILGTNTESSIEFIDTLTKFQKEYYQNIVAKNPSQKIFLKGWLYRSEYMGFKE